ncbi:hypothetical protein [Streptomyces durhamensis]|uniref:hypothetical protein n=1 Tax=Streptomyces durhamensis TaxID=68194 RepID=UPI00068FF2D2|nr:hypothetical protein [Streptomyces durhamensis]
MAVGTGVAAFSAETVSPRPGAARSLIPRVAAPQAARRELVASIPVRMAPWTPAGLFMGLVANIIRDLLDLHSGLLNGATASAAGLSLGRLTPRRTVFLGGAACCWEPP